MRIDSHQHFWDYRTDAYAWIGDDMQLLRRSFLPNDLRPHLEAAGIGGTVAVQARETEQETEWLLSLAETHSFIKGVVGWLPLEPRPLAAALERFSDRRRLVGVREILQGKPDDAYLNRAAFHEALDLLPPAGLTYDVLVFAPQLPGAIALADRHPDLTLVLDHVAKPGIRAGQIEPWATNLRALAARPHVVCKLSGLVTEAHWQRWDEKTIVPYLESALEAFGPDRCMFGSDWPVCLLAAGYDRWVTIVSRFLSELSSDEQAAIWGGTARRCYGLD